MLGLFPLLPGPRPAEYKKNRDTRSCGQPGGRAFNNKCSRVQRPKVEEEEEEVLHPVVAHSSQLTAYS